MTDLPDSLQINAWTDDVSNRSDASQALERGLLSKPMALTDMRMLAPVPVDARNWRDPCVGWGIVLPDVPGLAPAELARGDDAPEPLRGLLADRAGTVLRYRSDRAPGMVRRYYDDGSGPQDVLVSAQNFGTGRGQVPRYLLICGAPDVIPWAFQFEVQQTCFAGRLDLEGEALERYVEALRNDWPDSRSERLNSLIWAVDHDTADITHLMRNAIARPLSERIRQDAEFAPGARFIDGLAGDATRDALKSALAENRPRFVATTSHGATGPLDDVARMRADLGLLVDSDRMRLDPVDLLNGWQPDGAVWYAHACCSAGALRQTAFSGLVREGSDVERILEGVAACGEMTSPLPRALLSAAKPLRAFIGHVEPTFDWSVRHNKTGQFLTQPLLEALYQRLFAGEPVGMALDSCRRLASDLLNVALGDERRNLAAATGSPGDILAIQLMAKDWRALVVLGDPTCTAV